MSATYGLITLVVMILIIMAIPVSIAGITYLMRKSKRNTIMQTLPEGVTYTVPVRLNTPKKNDAIMKMKAFEFIGILYVVGNIVYIKGPKPNQLYQYDLQTSAINWVGTQAQNGLIQWFALRDASGNTLYVNGETGLFIFRIGRSFPSTREIYEYLFKLQVAVNAGVTNR